MSLTGSMRAFGFERNQLEAKSLGWFRSCQYGWFSITDEPLPFESVEDLFDSNQSFTQVAAVEQSDKGLW